MSWRMARWLWLAGLVLAIRAGAREPVVLREGFRRATLEGHLSVLRDSGGRLTADEILAPAAQERFSPLAGAFPVFGFTKDAIWIRFSVRSASDRPLPVVAELALARFDRLDWHVVPADGGGRLTRSEGNLRPRQPSRGPMPAMEFTLAPGEERTVLIRVETETSVYFPLHLHTAEGYGASLVRRDVLVYGHLGLSLGLVLISLVLAFSLRSRLFGYYIGLVVCYLLHHWIHNGYYAWVGGGALPFMTRQGLLMAGAFSLMFLMGYLREFQGGEAPDRRLSGILLLAMALLGGLAVLIPFLPFTPGVLLVNLAWLAANGLGIGVSLWQYAVRRRQYWRFSLPAWGVSAVMVVVVLLELWGVMPMVLNPETAMRSMLLVITVFLMVAMVDRLHLLARRDLSAKEAGRELAEARFRALRYQVNPHFLFNTLNSIEALSREQADRIPELVRRLSRYLRATLEARSDALLPLGEEVESVRAYLGIEAVRFEDRLAVEFVVEPAAKAIRIPELILQPLVENAIKHGMRTSPPPLRIRISVRVEGKTLVLRVENSGRWIPERPENAGVGLRNLRERLALLFGAGSLLAVRPEEGRVVVELALPLDAKGSA